MDDYAEIFKYIRGQYPSNEAAEHALNTPISAFGNISAKEFGEKHGWEYVWATIRRMYG